MLYSLVPVCKGVCLYLSLSMSVCVVTVCLSLSLSVCKSVSGCQSLSLPESVPVVSGYLSLSLSVYVCLCLWLCLSLSVPGCHCLSLYVSVFTSCLSLSIFASVCLYLSLSVCISVSLYILSLLIYLSHCTHLLHLSHTRKKARRVMRTRKAKSALRLNAYFCRSANATIFFTRWSPGISRVVPQPVSAAGNVYHTATSSKTVCYRLVTLGQRKSDTLKEGERKRLCVIFLLSCRKGHLTLRRRERWRWIVDRRLAPLTTKLQPLRERA